MSSLPNRSDCSMASTTASFPSEAMRRASCGVSAIWYQGCDRANACAAASWRSIDFI